jgi:hypothetical protein
VAVHSKTTWPNVWLVGSCVRSAVPEGRDLRSNRVDVGRWLRRPRAAPRPHVSHLDAPPSPRPLTNPGGQGRGLPLLPRAPPLTLPMVTLESVLSLSCLCSMLRTGGLRTAHQSVEGESMGVSPRVVAYVRVSTDKQVEHGLSLEAQQAKLMAYAALYELDWSPLRSTPG